MYMKTMSTIYEGFHGNTIQANCFTFLLLTTVGSYILYINYICVTVLSVLV